MLIILFTILWKTHNIVTVLWQYCQHIVTVLFAILSTSTIRLTYILTVCCYNMVEISQYCYHIRLTYMLTVLWNLTIWWTILSQYSDNMVTIFWVVHNMLNNIVNILRQYCGRKCEGWWWYSAFFTQWGNCILRMGYHIFYQILYVWLKCVFQEYIELKSNSYPLFPSNSRVELI